MSLVIPTITAENPHVYREQIERTKTFATQLHIDLMDGVFTPNTSVSPEQIWWPDTIKADIHVMFQKPEQILPTLIKLKPRCVILPAECEANIKSIAATLQNADITCGVALLADTTVESVAGILPYVQHVLIFSGNLGYQGGSTANMELLEKINEARRINSELEIGWDGGVNDGNIAHIAQAGVDCINVGGYIQKAEDPAGAYARLQKLIA